MSSVAGLFISENAHTNYHAAKAAIIGLTHKVAFEEGPNGIRVNCVSPGSVMTERVKPRYDVLSPEEYARRMSGIALRRGSRPEEIAAAVLFLASDDASYITGTNLHVNGGRYMS
jgi:3-oxoacyl-[acyl-carrier protein] reductase